MAQQNWFAQFERMPASRPTSTSPAAPRTAAAAAPRDDAWFAQFEPVDAPMHPYQRVTEGAIGFLKGIGERAVDLGRLAHRVPGVSALFGEIPDDADEHLGLTPRNREQEIGRAIERAAEFVIPGAPAERAAVSVASRLLPRAPRTASLGARVVANSAATAAVTGSQGGDATTGAIVGAALPAGGAAVGAGAKWLQTRGERLVRAALKPTVTSMRRIAGGPADGLDAKANAMVRFIIDNRLTTPEKANTLVQQAERELQRVLAVKNAPADAPQRAMRYLSALEKSAAKQGLPADDVAILRNAAAELLEGPMGKDVITLVPTPHPTLVQPNGQPFMVLTPRTSRALRTDVMADEALTSARESSRWQTNKKWGEQKGTRVEATKAVERAQRDAVKEAVPEARPILKFQGRALQARETLDRMALREGNRDALSLQGAMVAAGETARRGAPGIFAFATNLLRNNQLPSGIWADRLARAVQSRDAQQVSSILSRFGIGLALSTR